MIRFAKNRANSEVYKGKVNPKPWKRLKAKVCELGKWTIKWARGLRLKVGTYLKKFVVNLKEKNCSYRFWDLNGLPCRHAYACIFHMEDELKKLC